MNFTLLLLSNAKLQDDLTTIANKKSFVRTINYVESEKEIEAFLKKRERNTVLISFGNGEILSKEILEELRYENVFNIHPASRFFPGRDPHHFAAYERVKSFGATVHYMLPHVDSGKIIDESLVEVAPNLKPVELQEISEAEGKNLFDSLLENIGAGTVKASDLKWGEKKTTRNDFLELAEICPTMTYTEIERREHAVDHPHHHNLSIQFESKPYTLIPNKSVESCRYASWSNFTEDGYRELIKTTLACDYEFEGFDTSSSDRHVLWRHDIDYSMIRAKRLGEIEARLGARSTFFIFLRSNFYNPLDKDNLDIMKFLADKGHQLGLHFDAAYYGGDLDIAQIEKFVRLERNILEESTAIPLKAISFHDPDAGNMLKHSHSRIGGLINAYSEYLRKEYGYCSDSNGYWRHRPIPEVIQSGNHNKIQVLTHPGWWTKHPLPPRKRVAQALFESARNILNDYDQHLESAGRKNIK